MVWILKIRQRRLEKCNRTVFNPNLKSLSAFLIRGQMQVTLKGNTLHQLNIQIVVELWCILSVVTVCSIFKHLVQFLFQELIINVALASWPSILLQTYGTRFFHNVILVAIEFEMHQSKSNRTNAKVLKNEALSSVMGALKPWRLQVWGVLLSEGKYKVLWKKTVNSCSAFNFVVEL